MEKRLEQAVLDLYAIDYSDHKLAKCIEGRGISTHFGWEPKWPLHYITFPGLAFSMKWLSGDFLEIGAHEGEFTVLLTELAKEEELPKRHVYVVDPWDGRQQGNEEVFNKFIEYMEPYSNFGFMRAGSESQEAKDWIASMNLCFAWVDGLHTYEAVKADIATAKTGFKGPGIIGLDDVRGPFHFNGPIMQAVRESEDDQWKHIESPHPFTHTFLVREV